MLPTVLYGCDTWSFILTEHRPRVFENIVALRRMKKEDTEENCVIRSFVIYIPHQIYWNKQIKENEMDRIKSKQEKEDKWIRRFGRKIRRKETIRKNQV